MSNRPDRLHAATCSIGIVTYLARFETYFKPLIKRLQVLFPDYEINVFINGHYDIVRQVNYLRQVTDFLGRFRHIRYTINLEHQPLARGWNWLLLLSTRPWVLVLNDDIFCHHEFRWHLESIDLPKLSKIFTLNYSWSHFVINKDIIKQIGWFDERFLGTGDEDTDYLFRLASCRVRIDHVVMNGILNYIAASDDAGWANISGIFYNKYSMLNREFLLKKWFRSDYGPVPAERSFTVHLHGEDLQVALNRECEPMPEYYPTACLEVPNPAGKPPSWLVCAAAGRARVLSLLSYGYWRWRRGISQVMRRFLGPRWEEVKGRIRSLISPGRQ